MPKRSEAIRATESAQESNAQKKSNIFLKIEQRDAHEGSGDGCRKGNQGYRCNGEGADQEQSCTFRSPEKRSIKTLL